jgi:ABC-type proline/glycine betaine transport system ATPase subunit
LKVFGNGELLEFDTPEMLLSNPNSHFVSLVEQTGPAEAEHLLTLANAAAANMKSKEPRTDTSEKLPPDSNEKDPLIV